MGRQTAAETAINTGAGGANLLDPGSLPATFQSEVIRENGDEAGLMYADIRIDTQSVSITRQAGPENGCIVIPVSQFSGVMVQVAPADATGKVKAKLILKHSEDRLSPVIAETSQPEDLAAVWPAWSKALDLPMLVCDPGGNIKPIEAFSATPVTGPTPRRRMALLTGRRPRFLIRRKTGVRGAGLTVHRGEREIIART